MAERVIEATVTALVLYWVLTNASSFNRVTNAVATTTVGGVRALWGM